MIFPGIGTPFYSGFIFYIRGSRGSSKTGALVAGRDGTGRDGANIPMRTAKWGSCSGPFLPWGILAGIQVPSGSLWRSTQGAPTLQPRVWGSSRSCGAVLHLYAAPGAERQTSECLWGQGNLEKGVGENS